MSDFLRHTIVSAVKPLVLPPGVANDIVEFLPVGGFVPASGHDDRWEISPDGLEVVRVGLLDSHVKTWPVDWESRSRAITVHECLGVIGVGVVAAGDVDTVGVALIEGDMLSSKGRYRHANFANATFSEGFGQGDTITIQVDVWEETLTFFKNGFVYGRPVPAYVGAGYHFVVDMDYQQCKVSIDRVV